MVSERRYHVGTVSVLSETEAKAIRFQLSQAAVDDTLEFFRLGGTRPAIEGARGPAGALASMPSTMGRATAPPAGALVLPPREPSRLSAHARDRPTVALLASTASLLRDMLASPDVRVSPAETGVLFSSFRGKTPSSPADVLAAATYVETRGGAANPVDAASRGITAGTLGSACVNLLNDLTDCLLTGKLHEAFLAAVKISDYRSRLYVMRLLLDRVPADRLHATKALVAALALSRRDHDAAEKKKNDGVPLPDDADAARSGGSSLDPVLRALVPCVLRGKAESTEESTEGEKENVPDASSSTRGGKGGGGDGDGALDVFRALVRERRYLLFKGEKTRGPEDRDDRASRPGSRSVTPGGSSAAERERAHERTRARNRISETAETRRVDSRVDRAYAARYSAMKRQKEGRGVERQKGAKSASVSSDDDAFLSERQTDAVVTREASSRELPEEEDPSEARVRMEAEMAVSLEEAVRRARSARDRQLRLTYVEPVPPPSRARAAEAYVREDETRDPRFPPTTPRRTYVRLHESREARARRLAERARRRARGEAVSSEDDDDVEAREATDTDVFKTVAFDPTNPLRRVSVSKHPGAASSRPEVGRDEEKRATTTPPGVESARRRVVDAARARRESGAVKPPPNPTTPIKSISPWLRRDDESQPAATSQPVRSREDDIDDDLDGRRASAVGFSRTRVQALGRAVAGSSDDVSVSKPSGRKKAVSLAELKRRITLADVSRSRERAARPSPEAERLRGVSARLRGAAGGDRDGAETANGERTKNRFADHPVAIPVAVGVAVRNPDSTYGVALPSVPLPEETEDDRRERRERARVAAFVDGRMPDTKKKKDGDENVRRSRIRDSAVVSSARRDDTAESPRVSLPSPSAREREVGASSRVGPPKKRRLEMSAAATSLQTSGPARVSRPKNIGLGEALGDEGEGDEGDDGDEGISPDALVRGPVALGADDAYEAAHERFDDDGEGARGSGSDAPSRSKKSYAGTRSSGGPTRDAAGRSRPTRGSLAAEGPAPGKVRLPAGFRRAAPGEAGAMRAADAAASGLGGLAAAARDGDDDASASEAAETRASLPDSSLAGSARLARIAARFRGDAPRRPPAGKRGPVAAPATARRGSPPSAPAPAPISAQAARAGPVEAAKRRAAAGAAARVEAAAARRARASDGDASDGSAEGSTRDRDGDGVEDDADDDARRRGFTPPRYRRRAFVVGASFGGRRLSRRRDGWRRRDGQDVLQQRAGAGSARGGDARRAG